jgi:mannose-1-phosphate guanylyltransferase
MTGIAAAMVLAAGRGQRMRPLSTVLPKPALPLPDGPVVASALRLAASAGISRIVVNTWHLAERMATAVAEVEVPGVEITLSEEASLMGTAGGLALARDRGLLGDEGPILVINGDGALGLDLQPLFEGHLGRDDVVTLALLPHLDPDRWSRVELDAEGRVAAIRPAGRPAAREVPFLYPGVMLVSRAGIRGLPSEPGEVPTALWQPAQLAGRLGGVVLGGHWREVGTPDDYLELVVNRLAGRSLVHATAQVDASARLNQALIGAGAVVDAGATVSRSAILHGAAVGRDGRVADAVLLGAVRTGAGEVLHDEFRVAAPPPS